MARMKYSPISSGSNEGESVGIGIEMSGKSDICSGSGGSSIFASTSCARRSSTSAASILPEPSGSLGVVVSIGRGSLAFFGLVCFLTFGLGGLGSYP